jgi:hypothetical protein
MPATRTVSTGPAEYRWVLPVTLIAVSVTAAAGLLARQVFAEPAAADSPAVVQTSSSIPPEAQPGPPTVGGRTDAAAHPLYQTVQRLLQAHFDAINSKDYQGWRAVVTRRRAQNQPEREWQVSYRSTRDGNIVVHRIEAGPPGTARALVSFTSVQNPEDAPLELPEPCIHWRVVLLLTVEGGEWKIDSGPTSATPQHEKC